MKSFQTIFIGAGLIAMSFFIFGCSSPTCSSTLNADHAVPPPSKVTDAASWELVWDDKIDDSLDRQAKVCRLRLVIQSGKATGNFDGPVLGQPRAAQFVGKLIPSYKTSLLIMEQREPGYTCAYQLQAIGAGYFGVWHDTHGGKGDVELHHASNNATVLSSP